MKKFNFNYSKKEKIITIVVLGVAIILGFIIGKISFDITHGKI